MAGRTVLLALLLFSVDAGAFAQKVQIGVLGLFHPMEITLSATEHEALVLRAADKVFVLEAGTRTGVAHLRAAEDDLVLEIDGQFVHAKRIFATGRDLLSARFLLGVPGKITRNYQGTLEVKAARGEVVPIVTMDMETAVASVVAAESDMNSPLEALKAQAVVTRSYVLAGKGRHQDFDFCDLTHCQFLREPPGPESLATVAANATRGLVIGYAGRPVAAMFTRSCGGSTRTPVELGIASSNYPYYAVRCEACYRAPRRWTRRISLQEAARLLGKGEAGRLAVDRRLGWNRVPSNNFAARVEEGEVILEGVGEGHGVGLCQRGAKAMAESGSSFREIIAYYFPNTKMTRVAP